MFLEHRLACPNVTSSYCDAFAVQVFETLVNRYAVMRHPFVKSRFALIFGNKTIEDQLAATLDIFHRCGGLAGGFRFRSVSDFSSNNYIEAPTPQDQLCEHISGNTYQLVRWYGTPSSVTPRRVIKKVVGGTVLASIFDGNTYTPTVDFTVDENTGVVTLDAPLASFETLYAGFEFDIPVQFETDMNDIQWQGADIMSTAINLIETLNPEALV
jgi:uncharacterized protein (TIGR02217 family)